MDQITEELRLIGEYGLRNKRELWRYKTMLSKIRGIARSLLGKTEEERAKLQRVYITKMARLGLLTSDAALDDILDLDIKSLLEKRLQTVIYRRGFSKTVHHAREMIVHGHVQVGERVVTVPSYFVTKEDDAQIAVIGGVAASEISPKDAPREQKEKSET